MKYFSYIAKLKADIRILALSNIALSIALAVIGVLFANLAGRKVVVILPPKVDKEFWVSGRKVSNTYLEQVGLFIADRLMSVSPSNVEDSLASIYPFLTTEPTTLKKLKSFFAEYISEIKENSYWQSFYPMRVDIVPKNRKIVVRGIVKKLSGNVYLGEERKSVEITFRIKNGRFLVEKLEVI